MLLGDDTGWLRRSLLSEAPKPKGDPEATSADYQLDDADATPPADEGETAPTDEAPADPEAEGGNYQLDGAAGDEPAGGEEDPAAADDPEADPRADLPADEGGDHPDGGNYQLDDTGDEPTDEGGGDAPADEGGDYQLDVDGGGDAGAADDVTAEGAVDGGGGDEDKLKKLILLGQFKELSLLANNLSVSVSNLDRYGDDSYDYVEDRIDDLKAKISFTLSNKFLKASYKELLKLFFFFKFQLKNLADLAEKLVEQGNNKINN